VPVVPIAYSRKFSGLFGSLGYRHNTDCKTQTADEILGAVVAGFENRQALATEVATAVALARTKLGAYEDVLRSLMAKR
jgi:polysaccharide pyruvyl transferase WcaK-like protein